MLARVDLWSALSALLEYVKPVHEVPLTRTARTRIDMVGSVKRTRPDREYPEKLPDLYKTLWPDLAQWPDATWVREFARTTRKDPDARLAILTGLRRYSSVELGTAWAGVAAYLAAVLGLVSAASGIAEVLPSAWAWLAWIPLAIVTVAFIVFFTRLMDLSGEADERRRSALAWLAAIEGEIQRTR